MKTSKGGLDFIVGNEALVLHPYRDSAGNPTIGVGHLLTEDELASGLININGVDVAWKNYLTEEQGMALFAQDLQSREDAVNSYGLDLTQNQFDALVDFTFNAGVGALQKLLSHGVDDVPNQLPKWNRAGGAVCEGLVNRRAAEVELWNS